MNPPNPRALSRLRGGVGFLVAAGVATAANYTAWLGLDDQRKTLGSDGNLHGPYEAWQVVGLVLGLGIIAAAVGWFGHPLSGAVVAAAVTTVGWSHTAANAAENDGLWPVGAALVAIGSFGGVLLVAVLAGWLRGRLPARSPT